MITAGVACPKQRLSHGLHLATALALRRHAPLDRVLAHDRQLGRAARALAFTVAGID